MVINRHFIAIGFIFMISSAFAQISIDTLFIGANNPFQYVTSINVQNIYISRYANESKETYANVSQFRFTHPIAGKVFLQLEVPLITFGYPSSSNFSSGVNTESGLGNLELSATFGFAHNGKSFIGFGPLLVLPTANNDVLANPNPQFGFVANAFHIKSPIFQFGTKIAFKATVADEGPGDRAQTLTWQPFYIWQVGNGAYVRGAPMCLFDLEYNNISIPFALGIGKVLKADNSVVNLFFEPQYSIYAEGFAPQFQIYAGVNIQLDYRQ